MKDTGQAQAFMRSESGKSKRRVANLAKSAGSALLDLCYPRDCIACGAPAGDTLHWFCDSCAGKLQPVRTDQDCCTSCGKPFNGTMSVDRRCAECTTLNPHWETGTTLLAFEGPAKDLVHGIKYHGLRCLLDDVRTFIQVRPDILERLRGSTLVPVPLFQTRHRERGFNQSEWLAMLFAEMSGAGYADLLRRVRDTGTQTALSREERRKNVRGAFTATQPVHEGARYVIVDDVITTGATLDACAATLRKAGATNVHVLTLAHA